MASNLAWIVSAADTKASTWAGERGPICMWQGGAEEEEEEQDAAAAAAAVPPCASPGTATTSFEPGAGVAAAPITPAVALPPPSAAAPTACRASEAMASTCAWSTAARWARPWGRRRRSINMDRRPG